MKFAIADANSKFGAPGLLISTTCCGLIESYYDLITSPSMRVRCVVRCSVSCAIRQSAAWVAEADRVAAGYMILTFTYDIEFGGMQRIVTDLYLERLSPPRSRRPAHRDRTGVLPLVQDRSDGGCR